MHLQGENNTGRNFLLLAHLDVVPAVPEFWETDPFKGVWTRNDSSDDEGYVVGRGAIDDKFAVVVSIAFKIMKVCCLCYVYAVLRSF